MALNDWIDLATEGEVSFVGSYLRFCIELWNLRISFPCQRIYLADDDVKNAFRWVKNNPAMVAAHAFQACGVTALMTGQSFGDKHTPTNWDHCALARTQHAEWLWENEPEPTLKWIRLSCTVTGFLGMVDVTKPRFFYRNSIKGETTPTLLEIMIDCFAVV